MRPTEKTMNANGPASGASAAAAWSAVWTFVLPLVHHEVGKRHSNHDVRTGGAELGVPQPAPAALRIGGSGGRQLIHLGGRLPEEEVGGDGGAEHGHQRQDEILGELDVRDDGGFDDLEERGMREERRDDVGEEGERQPLENLEDGGVGGEDLQADDQQGNRDDEPERVDRAP
jgi:hypothetical protein